MKTVLRSVTFLILTLSASQLNAEENKYDPLLIEEDAIIETLDLVVNDKKRDRAIPIKIYLPGTEASAPEPVG